MSDPTPIVPRVWYRDLILVSGLVLLVLGTGNWVTGTLRLREYAAIVSAPSPPDEGTRGDAAESADESAEMDVARVRMDFYHVVASGGRLMTAAGIVLTAFGLARSLRGEARRT